MIEGAKAAYRAILAIDDETPRLVRFVLRALAGRESPRVFDVGCGYGRTLRALRRGRAGDWHRRQSGDRRA